MAWGLLTIVPYLINEQPPLGAALGGMQSRQAEMAGNRCGWAISKIIGCMKICVWLRQAFELTT